jgi:predicted Zn finger-like uncharacterized protein
MIVQCPNCSTTYNFEDDMVKSEGVKARCTVCEHVFVVTPESDVSQRMAEQKAPPREEPVEEEAPASEPEEQDAPEPEEEVEEAEPADAGAGLSLDLDEGGKKKKEKTPKGEGGGGRKKLVLAALLALVLLAGGGAAGVYFFAPELIPAGLAPSPEETAAPDETGEPAEPAETAETDEGVQEETPAEPEADGEKAEAAPDVRNIVLQDIRQYYVDNDKAGRVFVVEGKAVNDFEGPKEHVTVQVSLLDADGETLAEKTFLAGNTLDLYGLQNLSREKIEEALSDRMDVASKNMNVKPGQGVPFMSVFFDPPAGVREFLVKVVDVSDPA